MKKMCLTGGIHLIKKGWGTVGGANKMNIHRQVENQFHSATVVYDQGVRTVVSRDAYLYTPLPKN